MVGAPKGGLIFGGSLFLGGRLLTTRGVESTLPKLGIVQHHHAFIAPHTMGEALGQGSGSHVFLSRNIPNYCGILWNILEYCEIFVHLVGGARFHPHERQMTTPKAVGPWPRGHCLCVTGWVVWKIVTLVTGCVVWKIIPLWG